MNEQITALVKRTSSALPIADQAIYLNDYIDVDPPASQDAQVISAPAMKQGTHVVAGVGAGKSTLLSDLTYQQLKQGKAAVVFDPTGGVVDNLFDIILRLRPELQVLVWPQIVYITPGDEDIIFPSPLYYRKSEKDTFFKMANRFPLILKQLDPELSRAPILGLNSLLECATFAGEIAAATGQQLDFVADLLDHPGKYRGLLRQVLADHPQLQPAVEYFRRLMDPNAAKLKEKHTGSFKNKLLPFLADPTRMATYAAKVNLLDWVKLLKQRKIILIDYRQDDDPDQLQFDMNWHVKGLIDAIKFRGMAGRGQEVLCIIDEITAMLGLRTNDGQALLDEDLKGLISRYGRAYGVNTVIAHQGLYQLDEQMQNVLMSMGNQLIGQLSAPDDAVRVARQFLRYDPYKVKKTENVWHTIHPPAILSFFGGPEYPYPKIIDKKFIEFTPEDQLLDWVNKLMDLDRYEFYAQIATGEGGKKNPVKKLRIANPNKKEHPQEQFIAPLRQRLARRDGLPLAKLLAEMRTSLIEITPEQKAKSPKGPTKSATMKGTHDLHSAQPTPSISNPGDSPLAPIVEGGDTTDDFWESIPATKTDSTHPAR